MYVDHINSSDVKLYMSMLIIITGRSMVYLKLILDWSSTMSLANNPLSFLVYWHEISMFESNKYISTLCLFLLNINRVAGNCVKVDTTHAYDIGWLKEQYLVLSPCLWHTSFPFISPGNLGVIPHWGLWHVYSFLECNASYFSNILVRKYHVGASLSVHTIIGVLNYQRVCQRSISLLEDKGLQHLLSFPRNRRTCRWMMYSVTVNLHLCWCLAHYMLSTGLG